MRESSIKDDLLESSLKDGGLGAGKPTPVTSTQRDTHII
jgi:hypothetical protein